MSVETQKATVIRSFKDLEVYRGTQAFPDAIGSAHEVLVWLDMAQECGYVPAKSHEILYEAYQAAGRRLHTLLEHWKTYK